MALSIPRLAAPQPLASRFEVKVRGSRFESVRPARHGMFGAARLDCKSIRAYRPRPSPARAVRAVTQGPLEGRPRRLAGCCSCLALARAPDMFAAGRLGMLPSPSHGKE